MWFLLAFFAAVIYTAMWVAIRASAKIPVTIVQIAYSISGPLLMIGFHPPQAAWSSSVWWMFLGWMFLVNPVFSWLFTYAVQRTDLTISKPLSSVSSVVAMATAWAAFGENLPAFGIAGILIAAAGMWALYHTRVHAWRTSYPWILLMCVASFGVNSVITHETLKIYPDPFVLTGIGFTGSLPWWIGIALAKHVTWRPTKGSLWMLLVITVTTAVQDVSTTVALGMAPAAYVVSIKRLSILFTSVIGYVYFKERELTLTRLIVATCVVITGAILLVV
ncbi:MAG TPA: hypothetical protein VHA78_06115 [Candidatus Peribacteraceae bacterium]|nr:hypothetical protein [Candidatus Peribacteraceae bacterium]